MVKEYQIQSFEELMEHIERQARKRVEKIVDKYKKLSGIESYDTIILKVLKEANEPVSVELISFLTGISKSRCCRILKRLDKKWGMIKKVTVRETAYYTLI